MKIKNNRFLTRILLIAVTIAISVSCAKAPIVSEYKEDVVIIDTLPVLPVLKPFNISNLKEHIEDLDIKFPKIVLAQALLESGNFSSAIFLENNNMFGMKCARRRKTTHQGERRGHAYFETWQDCVLDYSYFQSTYVYHADTEEEYFEYLSNNYAEDPLYVHKLKNIIHNKL
jgi:hypothetical protein